MALERSASELELVEREGIWAARGTEGYFFVVHAEQQPHVLRSARKEIVDKQTVRNQVAFPEAPWFSRKPVQPL